MDRLARWWCVGCAVALVGCGSSVTIGNVSVDSGAADAGSVVDAPVVAVDAPVAIIDAPVVPPGDLGAAGCDGVSPAVGTPCSVGLGACQRAGRYLCRADLRITLCDATPTPPMPETCNGIDDDCNGMVDEVAPRTCFDGPAAANGVGVCRAGTQACLSGMWGPCASQVVPAAETCNGLDDDCDGSVDESVVQRCGDLSWSMPGRYTRAVTPMAPRAYVDACALPGHRTYLPNADDGNASEALPFAFQAFGVPVTTAYFTANGVLGFSTATWNFNNTALPAARGSQSVYAFWDDLALRDGICTATVGTAPNRTFVVEWHDAGFFPRMEEAHLSFEVVLVEGSNLIEVLYQRMEGASDRALGSNATTGIQGDDTPGSTDTVSFNMARPMLAGSAIRWSPAPVDMRGVCRAGSQTCRAGAWGACTGEVGPSAERCGNALDDDCDGNVDNGCP